MKTANRYLAIKGCSPWKNLKPHKECVAEADNTAKQPAARQVWRQNTCKQTQSPTKGEFDFHLKPNITQSVPTSISILPQVSLKVLSVMSTDTQMTTQSEQEQLLLCNWSDQAGWLIL